MSVKLLFILTTCSLPLQLPALRKTSFFLRECRNISKHSDESRQNDWAFSARFATPATPCISLCRLYMYRSFVLWFSTFKSFHSFSRDVSCLATLFLNEIKKNNAFLYSPHLHLRVVLFGLLLDMHDELYDEDRIGTTPFTTRHDRSWYHEMP